MDFKRNSLWLLPLLVMVSGPWWWPAAGALLKPRGDFAHPAPPAIDQLKSFVMEGVVLTQHRAGRDEFILKAARVNSGLHEDVLALEEIEASLFGADGSATLLTGGEALYHTDHQILTVLDNVQIQTPDGQAMRTAALRYLIKYRKVKTAEAVTLVAAKARVTGGNMFYDLGDGNFRFGGGVKVDLY
jgi:LPS export ABC transporter protein LptC